MAFTIFKTNWASLRSTHRKVLHTSPYLEQVLWHGVGYVQGKASILDVPFSFFPFSFSSFYILLFPSFLSSSNSSFPYSSFSLQYLNKVLSYFIALWRVRKNFQHVVGHEMATVRFRRSSISRLFISPAALVDLDFRKNDPTADNGRISNLLSRTRMSEAGFFARSVLMVILMHSWRPGNWETRQ